MKRVDLERRIADLVKRCQEAMAEAVREGCDPHDAQVYMAGRRDVYVGHVIDVLADLGVSVPVPNG